MKQKLLCLGVALFFAFAVVNVASAQTAGGGCPCIQSAGCPCVKAAPSCYVPAYYPPTVVYPYYPVTYRVALLPRLYRPVVYYPFYYPGAYSCGPYRCW